MKNQIKLKSGDYTIWALSAGMMQRQRTPNGGEVFLYWNLGDDSRFTVRHVASADRFGAILYERSFTYITNARAAWRNCIG